MKKSILIIGIVLITLGLTAFGLINWNDPVTDVAETSSSESVVVDKPVQVGMTETLVRDFYYGIGTRFNSITKTALVNLRSFDDYIGEEHAQRIVAYKSLSVIVLKDSEQTDIRETGNSGVFSPAQLKLLKSFDYSTNILIWADYTEKNKDNGIIEDGSWTPYLTIVPETQASYVSGNETLINYLKENSIEETIGLNQGNVKSGKLYFTVTKKGLISNIEVVSTSGFPKVDEKIKELILKLPGKWKPAQNSNGEAVDQTLVISFGNMGC